MAFKNLGPCKGTHFTFLRILFKQNIFDKIQQIYVHTKIHQIPSERHPTRANKLPKEFDQTLA